MFGTYFKRASQKLETEEKTPNVKQHALNFREENRDTSGKTDIHEKRPKASMPSG